MLLRPWNTWRFLPYRHFISCDLISMQNKIIVYIYIYLYTYFRQYSILIHRKLWNNLEEGHSFGGGGGLTRVDPLEGGENKKIKCHKIEKTNVVNLWCKHRNRHFVTHLSKEVLMKDIRRKDPLYFVSQAPKFLSALQISKILFLSLQQFFKWKKVRKLI